MRDLSRGTSTPQETMLITTIRLNLIEFGRDEVEAMIDPLLHAQVNMVDDLCWKLDATYA